MASHRKAAPTTSWVSRLLYFTCMKNRMTSVALKTAMPRATTALNGPKSWVAAQTVRNSPTIKMPKTA